MSEIPAFTPLGTEPPNRSMQEDVYVPAADAFAAWIPGVTSEIEVALTWTAEQLTFVEQKKQEVISASEASAASATAAAQAQAAAESVANFKGRYADLSGALNRPATVLDNNRFWVLLVDLPNVTASAPSDNNPDWQPVQTPIAQSHAIALSF